LQTTKVRQILFSKDSSQVNSYILINTWHFGLKLAVVTVELLLYTWIMFVSVVVRLEKTQMGVKTMFSRITSL